MFRKGFAASFIFAIAFACFTQPVSAGSFLSPLDTAGVANILESKYTEEEYVTMAQEAVGALWGYTNLGIANVEGVAFVNVYEKTDSSSEAVGRMYHGCACEVLDYEDGWYRIQSGNVEGYVEENHLLTGPEARLLADELVKPVVISETDHLYIRESAKKKGAALGSLSKGEELEYLEDAGDWTKVLFDGQEAYVASEYISLGSALDTAVSKYEILYGDDISEERASLVEFAKQFVGNPYVWGGTSLTRGADCSGFVLSVFKEYGVELPHYSVAQSEKGTKITAAELLPGDLVFYGTSSVKINHVAIYIGNGQVVHASSPKNGIKISEYDYRKPVKCVRILEK